MCSNISQKAGENFGGSGSCFSAVAVTLTAGLVLVEILKIYKISDSLYLIFERNCMLHAIPTKCVRFLESKSYAAHQSELPAFIVHCVP